MPEGVAVAGKLVAVHDDPDKPPPPGPVAPKGWTWNRQDRAWSPKVRGPVIWTPVGAEQDSAPAPPAEPPEDAGESPGRDPAPGWQGDTGEPDREPIRPEDIPQAVKDDAASFAGMLGMPVLAFLRTVDPYCGQVISDNYGDIVDACLPLVLRSEKVRAFFTATDSAWLQWLGLAQVLWPVATAIAQHHVFHTVRVVKDEKTGAVSILRGREQEADPLQPPVVDEFNYHQAA